jgi:hypothetical protein
MLDVPHVRTDLNSCDFTSPTRLPGPILLGNSLTDADHIVDWQKLPVQRDEEQVKLDVHRAFVYYPLSMHSGMGPMANAVC